jgi:hypothetical protein
VHNLTMSVLSIADMASRAGPSDSRSRYDDQRSSVASTTRDVPDPDSTGILKFLI